LRLIMKYLTPAQVAEELNCSLDHVYDLIRAGVLSARDISRPGAKRRTYRISAVALEHLPLVPVPGEDGRGSPPPTRGRGGMAEFERVVSRIKKRAKEARASKKGGAPIV
jgi:excisionase family DNA binding protein